MSTVEEYKSAMNELAAAQKEYAPIHRYLTAIGEAVGYGGNNAMEFLRGTFGLQYERSRSSLPDPRYRLDLQNWPSVEEVRSAGKRLAAAYNAVHKVYAALPVDDREYVKQPPYHIELRG